MCRTEFLEVLGNRLELDCPLADELLDCEAELDFRDDETVSFNVNLEKLEKQSSINYRLYLRSFVSQDSVFLFEQ